jgi:hypothetical protein
MHKLIFYSSLRRLARHRSERGGSVYYHFALNNCVAEKVKIEAVLLFSIKVILWRGENYDIL